jgi:hypothetical protein
LADSPVQYDVNKIAELGEPAAILALLALPLEIVAGLLRLLSKGLHVLHHFCVATLAFRDSIVGHSDLPTKIFYLPFGLDDLLFHRRYDKSPPSSLHALGKLDNGQRLA